MFGYVPFECSGLFFFSKFCVLSAAVEACLACDSTMGFLMALSRTPVDSLEVCTLCSCICGEQSTSVETGLFTVGALFALSWIRFGAGSELSVDTELSAFLFTALSTVCL